MNKEIYIVEFSSANYCGAPEHCAVMASSVEEAMENPAVIDYAEDFYCEQDEDQYSEENDHNCAEMYASIDRAVRLVGSEYEEYYADEKQREAFYPMVG